MELIITLINEKGFIDCLSALLTPVISILGAYIAYQQWNTSEKQRKQNLFEKRYDNLYKPLISCLDNIEVINSKKITNTEKELLIQKEIEKFWNEYSKYSFLISEEDNEKLKVCYSELLAASKQNISKDDKTIIMPFLLYQLVTIKNIFEKYLRIEPSSFRFRLKKHKDKKYSMVDIYNEIQKQGNKK